MDAADRHQTSLYRRAALDLVCLAQLGRDATLVELCRDSLSMVASKRDVPISADIELGIALLIERLDGGTLGLSAIERALVHQGIAFLKKSMTPSLMAVAGLSAAVAVADLTTI